MAQTGDDDLTSSDDVIREARRPIIIDRHRALVEEMEIGIGEPWITGETDHPRLKAMLADLELESERGRIRRTVDALTDGRYRDHTLRRAIIEELCLLRENAGIEIASLQMHAIGVYRSVRTALAKRQGEAPSLAELREMPTQRVAALGSTASTAFGQPDLQDALVYGPAFGDRALATFKRLRRSDDADSHWDDVEGLPTLGREAEEPLLSLPEAEQKAARLLLQRDKVRSRFYRTVFLHYLSRDELDPSEVESHPTVLSWLLGMEATGHLYPFLQGQTAGQKAFRIGQLAQKIIQLHEMYARVAKAEAHSGYRDRFAGKTTRERLGMLAADRHPPLALTRELTLAALLCPFAALVEFVQTKAESKDFIIPPDPRR
jgi:hypothetical protein